MAAFPEYLLKFYVFNDTDLAASWQSWSAKSVFATISNIRSGAVHVTGGVTGNGKRSIGASGNVLKSVRAKAGGAGSW